MEETESKGGGGAEEVEGEAGEEERNQIRAREEIGTTEERRGRKNEEGRG